MEHVGIYGMLTLSGALASEVTFIASFVLRLWDGIHGDGYFPRSSNTLVFEHLT